MNQTHDIETRNHLTSYAYAYLENGKLITEEKEVKFQPKDKMTLMSLNQTSVEIDVTGCGVRRELTMRDTFRELVCTWTMRATRSKERK